MARYFSYPFTYYSFLRQNVVGKLTMDRDKWISMRQKKLKVQFFMEWCSCSCEIDRMRSKAFDLSVLRLNRMGNYNNKTAFGITLAKFVHLWLLSCVTKSQISSVKSIFGPKEMWVFSLLGSSQNCSIFITEFCILFDILDKVDQAIFVQLPIPEVIPCVEHFISWNKGCRTLTEKKILFPPTVFTNKKMIIFLVLKKYD